MKQLIRDILRDRVDYTLIFFEDIPIYVENSVIPIHYRLARMFISQDLYSLFLLDYISDHCNVIDIIKNFNVVILYIDDVNGYPHVNPITSKNLSKEGYLNLSSQNLDKLISCYLPNINFTCSMAKFANISSKYTAVISENSVDFGKIPIDRNLFVFLKSIVASIILADELNNRSALDIDLEDLDSLLVDGESSSILKSFYPSGNLLFNLKTGLDHSKVSDLLSKVSRIPEKAIPYFL